MKLASPTTRSLLWPRRKPQATLLLWLLFTSGLALAASSLEVPLCIFKAMTGLPCPACGMGHACRAAMQGDAAASFQHHPLGVPAMLFLGITYAFLSADVLRGRSRTYEFLSRLWPRWVVVSTVGVILATWVWRLVL